MPGLRRAKQPPALDQGSVRGHADGFVEQQDSVYGRAASSQVRPVLDGLPAPGGAVGLCGLVDQPREAQTPLDRLVIHEAQLGNLADP